MIMITPASRGPECPARLASNGRPAVTEDGMRLLALVDSPDHVCCRYRIRAFEPALNAAGWSLTCQPLQRGSFSRVAQLRARRRRYDSVILQRKLLPALAACHPPPARAPPGLRFRRRRPLPRLVRPRGPHSAWRQAPVRRDRPARRRRHRRATISWPTAPCGPGRPPSRSRLIPTCVDPGRYPLADEPAGRGSLGRTGRPRLDRLVEHAPGAGAAARRSGSGWAARSPACGSGSSATGSPSFTDASGRPRPLGRGDRRPATWRPATSGSAGCPTTSGAGASAA